GLVVLMVRDGLPRTAIDRGCVPRCVPTMTRQRGELPRECYRHLRLPGDPSLKATKSIEVRVPKAEGGNSSRGHPATLAWTHCAQMLVTHSSCRRIKEARRRARERT